MKEEVVEGTTLRQCVHARQAFVDLELLLFLLLSTVEPPTLQTCWATCISLSSIQEKLESKHIVSSENLYARIPC